jgi:3-oxoacyl-[acyl-carrier protein] reductase
VKLLGKVALVTGSARGLGKAAALELARAGATVIINDLPSNEALAAATVDELRHGDLSADLALANVGDEAQIEALIGEIVARHGRLDILVNNAGINRDSTIRKATSADWDLVAGVNLRGPFLCTRAALNPMREQGWGRVVNVASVVGKTGVPGTSYYAAAKGGLISLTKAVASEVARFGITVNAVAPGYIDTDMTRGFDGAVRDNILARIPAGRLGRPEEIAAAIAFLASPDASYITGAVLDVNGGYYM